MAEKLLMTALSPTMENGLIVKWNKKEGDLIQSGDILCEVETDKATMDYESSVDGELLKILLPEGRKAFIGDPIAIVGDKSEDLSQLLVDSKSKPDKETSIISDFTHAEKEIKQLQRQKHAIDKIKVSPLARRIAAENMITLHDIIGTGPEGRIVKRDLENIIKGKKNKSINIVNPLAIETIGDKSIPITEKRRIIAKRLSESMYSAPHYYLKLSVNMDKILSERSEFNQVAKEKISMNAYLIKFVAEALKRHPMINANWQGDTISKFAKADIGLAVAQQDGLITPIVKDCGNKGILAVDYELRILIDKAKKGKLMPEEFIGATFTISNLGSYGIEEFTAIINPPGSAILAVGKIIKEPTVSMNNEIEIHSNVRLTLSCDHRVIDGVVGASFLNDLKIMMENPIKTLY